MLSQVELRQERGKAISMMEDQIRRETDFEYYVRSQVKENKEYRVFHTMEGWSCTCPDYSFRGFDCKHIYAVEFSLKLREEVKENITVVSPIIVSKCGFCGSEKLRKYGIRRNRSGDIQRYLCEFCKRTFSVNIGFEKMKHNPQAVTTAMQLYFSGESLRNTCKSLKLLGVEVCYSTVYKWINKYIGMMEKYIDKIQPQVSGTWRADEMYIKFRGNMKYMFALMDDQTRYWIAQEVADTKFTHDARHLLRSAKDTAGRLPNKLITDGLGAYSEAFRKEYAMPFNRKASPIHIREIQLSNKTIHNNKMERMNGEVRDREKTMRGLKSEDSPILRGYKVYHNFIRTHESLNGQTPADLAGIKVEGQNKWLTLIQNGSLQPKINTEKKEGLDNFAT